MEPLDGLEEKEADYVLGGQGCQWSEGINEHNFDARTFTNLAAVAERLCEYVYFSQKYCAQCMNNQIKSSDPKNAYCIKMRVKSYVAERLCEYNDMYRVPECCLM